MYYVGSREEGRYGFALTRLVTEEQFPVGDETIGTARLMVTGTADLDRLRSGMRSWALATLAAGGFGFGQYEVAMGELDDEDDCDGSCGHETIAWNGESELLPARP